MEKKYTLYSELAYVYGMIGLAVGTAFMTRADFGMSMVVAPAYIVHLKVSETLPFFTFGMAEYTLQLILIILMSIVLRRFKWPYLFSFITAVIYGFMLDGSIFLTGFIPGEGIASRIIFMLVGMVLCAIGVAFIFKTYISPEAYELFVKEVATVKGISISKFKTGYDVVSCTVSVILSFVFFGLFVFRGVGVATVVTALVNGYIIGQVSKLIDNKCEIKDKLKFRSFFEQNKN